MEIFGRRTIVNGEKNKQARWYGAWTYNFPGQGEWKRSEIEVLGQNKRVPQVR